MKKALKTASQSHALATASRPGPARLPAARPRAATEPTFQPELGNQAVQWLWRTGALHAKLTVGAPDDPLEKEADAVADRATRSPAPRLRRQCDCGGPSGANGECEACRNKRMEQSADASVVRRLPVDPGGRREAPAIVHQTLGGAGRPLDSAARADMEHRFGADFGDVRIHTGPQAADSARAVGARAYTVGSNIAFAEGRYAPHSEAGRWLLAHELAHVAQHGPAVIRRYSAEEFGNDLNDTVDTVRQGASNAMTTAGQMVDSAGQRISDVAADIYRGASQTANDFGQSVDAAEAAINQSVGSAAAAVGSFALDQANALARLFGGSVRIVGTALVIDLPAVPLFRSWSGTVSVLQIDRLIPKFIPLLPIGFAVGPLAVEGALAIRFGNPTMNAGLGPAWLRNVTITLDPIKRSASGSGEIYVGGAVSESVEAALEVALAAEGVLPTEPPIPIIGTIEVGARAILRGIGKGAVQNQVIVSYTDGSIAVDADLGLKLGALIELDTEIFLEAVVEGEDICKLIWPLSSHRLAENAEQFNLPVKLGYNRGLPSISFGEIESKPIPVDSIQTYLLDNRPPDQCLGIEQILQRLCKIGKLPPSVCSVVQGPLVVPRAPSVAPTSTDGLHQAPTGTKKDPISMLWAKPLGSYDNPIRLDGGTYYRDRRGRLTTGETIGVGFWPGAGDLVRKNPRPRGRAADRFKAALENDGYERWDENSPDHVLDLFFDGPDSFGNLWPLDRDVNRLAGTWHPGQGVDFNLPSDPPDHPPRREAIASSNLDGCWFVIKKVVSW
jgi:hypothetical protein